MKQSLLAFSLLLVAACAKAPASGNTASRDLIDSSSTNRQLKNESQDLSNAIRDIGKLVEQGSDLCDDMGERVLAFNEALGARQQNLAALLEQKEDIRNFLRPAREKFRVAAEDEAKSKGLIAGWTRSLNYQTKGAAAKDFYRVDKKQLAHDRGVEERKLRKALKAKNDAEYMSDAYERAEADETAARVALGSIKGQLKALSCTIAGTVNQNIATLNGYLAAEDPKLKDAQARKASAEGDIAIFRGQLKSKLREIAQLPKIDNLSPLEVPASCEIP